MIDNHLPMFTNQALCADTAHDPDWWHPQELAGKGRKWSHTLDAERARSLCSICPAKQECRKYALQYFNLTGIWGGLDRLERHTMQKALGMDPENWTDTWGCSVYRVPHERKEDVQG